MALHTYLRRGALCVRCVAKVEKWDRKGAPFTELTMPLSLPLMLPLLLMLVL